MDCQSFLLAQVLAVQDLHHGGPGGGSSRPVELEVLDQAWGGPVDQVAAVCC